MPINTKKLAKTMILSVLMGNPHTSMATQADVSGLKGFAKTLEEYRNRMNQKGNDNKNKGQSLSAAGQGLMSTGIGITMIGALLQSQGQTMVTHAEAELARCQTDQVSCPLAEAELVTGTSKVKVGKTMLYSGLGTMAAGMGVSVAGMSKQSKGDGQKSDAALSNNYAAQTRVAADERTGPINAQLVGESRRNQPNEKLDPVKFDSNGDGVLSRDEVMATLDPKVLELLNQYGKLDGALNEALKNGDLAGKLENLYGDKVPYPGTPEFEQFQKDQQGKLYEAAALAQENGIDLSGAGLTPDMFGEGSSSHSNDVANDNKSGEHVGTNVATQSSGSIPTQNESSGEKSEEKKLDLSSIFGLPKSKVDPAKTHLGEQGTGWFHGEIANQGSSLYSFLNRRPSSLGPRNLFEMVSLRYQAEFNLK